MGTRAAAAMCLGLLVGAPVAVRAQDQTERVSRTLKLDPGGTLRLKNFSGRVTISPTDRPEVVIDAVRRAPRERLDRVRLDIRTEGSTIVVDANQHDRSWLSHRNNVVRTEFDIKVPSRTNLDLEVFSSSVDVRGVEGSHKLHAFSGELSLNDIVGPVRAHTFSGRVFISERTWPADETIDVETFSGGVELHLPDAARGRVSFNSFSGHLTSDVPLTLRTASRKRVEGTLGKDGGSSELRLKTFSGNVRIER